MAGISFSGLATGIDTASLISQLMTLERQPQQLLTKKKSSIQSKISEFNNISASLADFKSLMNGMKTEATFSGRTVSVSNTAAVTATVTSAAMPGRHTVTVDSLPRPQTQVGRTGAEGGYASSSELNFGVGTITISGAGEPVTVTINDSNKSLGGIAAAINASGANVTASIINTGDATAPYQLVLTGKDTGTYSVTADLSGGSYESPLFTTTLSASPARLTVDGIPISRTEAKNAIADVIPGVSLTLLKENETVQIDISNDAAGITAKINSFINAYNNAMSLLNKQSNYNATTKSSGVLSGDFTIRSMKQQLQSVVTTQVASLSGQYSSLSRIGITSNAKDGSLSLDAKKFNAALAADFQGVVDLFTINSDVKGLAADQYGIAPQFSSLLDKITKSYVSAGYADNGVIATRVKGLSKSISDIDKQIDAMEVRLAQKEQSLKKQYTALESLVNSLNSQGNAMIAQLNNL
jgi:flagellar hook-associated protein 2